jgi:hypothetical protein
MPDRGYQLMQPPNRALKLTPLCGRKIGGILIDRNGPNAFLIYNGGAA